VRAIQKRGSTVVLTDRGKPKVGSAWGKENRRDPRQKNSIIDPQNGTKRKMKRGKNFNQQLPGKLTPEN